MSRWTDTPAPQEPETQPSRFRRSLAEVSEFLSGKGASAAILVRAGVAIGLVGLVTIGLMIQGRASREPAPQVKTPNFTTVPVVRRDVRPPRNASAISPLFSTAAILPTGQTFLPRTRPGAEAFCEDLADLGFAKARWEPSPVFANEWECAAPLRGDDPNGGAAFLVARGRREDAVGSLMLRLNPASAEQRPELENLAAKTHEVFASETGLILPQEALRLLKGWAAGEVAGIGGRMRLVNDRAKPNSLVVNFTVEPRLAVLPTYPCDAGCAGRMRALAKTAETRSVKTKEP